MVPLPQSRLYWSSSTSLICSVAGEGCASRRARQSDNGLSQRAARPVRSSAATQTTATAPANRP